MSVSPLDYRYGREEAKSIWSREGRHSRQLEVERALVWAHCRMGRVSAEHYDIVADISDPGIVTACLLYTSPSPRDRTRSRMPSSA